MRQILSFLFLCSAVFASAGTRIKPRMVLLRDTLRLECNGTLETVDVESGSLELPGSEDIWGLWRLEIRPPAKTQGFHDAWKLLQGSNADSLRVVLGKDSLTLVNRAEDAPIPGCPGKIREGLGTLQLELGTDSFQVMPYGAQQTLVLSGSSLLRKCGLDLVFPAVKDRPRHAQQMKACIDIEKKQKLQWLRLKNPGIEISDVDLQETRRDSPFSQYVTARNRPVWLFSQPETPARATMNHLRKTLALLMEGATTCQREAWWKRLEWILPEDLEWPGNYACEEDGCLGGSPMKVARGRAELSDIALAGDTAVRSRESILQVISRHLGGFRHTSAKFLKEEPNLRGKIPLQFVISPSGDIVRVTVIGSSTGNAVLDEEIKDKARRMKFDAVETGTITVSMAITLKPNGVRSCKERR